jgi:hypothetical protein
MAAGAAAPSAPLVAIRTRVVASPSVALRTVIVSLALSGSAS